MQQVSRALAALLLVGACSSGTSDAAKTQGSQPSAEGSQQHGLAPEQETAGGCACPAQWDAPAEISLACFCAEFPAGCPSYDELKSPTTPLAGPRCTDDSSWPMTEQVGCGQLTLSVAGPYGGETYVYDEPTHTLIGAATSSDAAYGACRTSAYRAGVQPTCTEGKVCSACDSSGKACLPACTMDALSHLMPFGVPHLVNEPLDCSGLDTASRPLLTTGCGRIILSDTLGVATFEATSHQPVGMVYADSAGFCGGHWGEAPVACAEQTTCTPCAGAPNSCWK